eukprot:7144053-Pyramimonas_sp.AAC.1
MMRKSSRVASHSPHADAISSALPSGQAQATPPAAGLRSLSGTGSSGLIARCAAHQNCAETLSSCASLTGARPPPGAGSGIARM